MVDQARMLDVNCLVRMSQEFLEQAPNALPYCPMHAKASFAAHIQDEDKACFVIRAADTVVGFLAAVATPSPITPKRLAIETGWFVTEDYRGTGSIRLVRAFEEWGRELNCYAAKLSRLEGLTNEGAYSRLGYAKFEESWVKVL